LGFRLDVPGFVLQKGGGRILGSAHVDLDGKVQAHAVATGVPIGHLQGAAPLGRSMRGELSAIAEVSGTVDALAATANVQISPARVGHFTLPASELVVSLVPVSNRSKTVGKSGCGRPQFGPFDRKEYDADQSAGVFHVNGQLFGNQIALDDLTITRQRAKRVAGKVTFSDLDLAAIAELQPEVTLAKTRPAGSLSGNLELESLSLNEPGLARGRLTIDELWLHYGGFRLQTLEKSSVTLKDRNLTIAQTALGARTPNSKDSRIVLGGTINRLGTKPTADLSVKLEPTPFATFAELIPNVERAAGELYGNLHLTGGLDQLRYEGGIDLKGGEIGLRTSPLNLTDIDVHVALNTGMLRLERATMKVGGGTVSIRGSAPLSGFDLGDATGSIEARDVSLAPAEGVRLALDADLEVSRKAQAESAKINLPELRGEVRLKSFQYSRPVAMTVDIATLAQRGRRTEFESYDPESDFFSFNVALRSDKALRINNNLIDARLAIDTRDLILSGTNQRFGARGRLRIEPGGQIRLRRNNFEIREGSVQFDDSTELAPRVDVTAVTDYRRYSSYVAPAADGTGGAAGGGGQWHITLHAYGDAEKLRIDLSSLPELSEDDIFLLLTLGLTRAELDQAQSARLGESVALEALGSLTGADQAVTEAIPVIDEFRFGSAYSSRTGQTEPTVTIGKRLSDRIRTLITSGLSESREVRSNLEWRLNRRLSVEGSYDNVNDISSSSLGNIGADIRWRLEFE
jgi:translocation and assembly module TamB